MGLGGEKYLSGLKIAGIAKLYFCFNCLIYWAGIWLNGLDINTVTTKRHKKKNYVRKFSKNVQAISY